MNSQTEHCVIKVGGSLLDWPELAPTLVSWLDRRVVSSCDVVVGGGREVDRIRRDQPLRGWSDEECHWRAIEVMSATSRQLAQETGLPTVCLDNARSACGKSSESVHCRSGRLAAARGTNPTCWQFTSDSIAAWYAKTRSRPPSLFFSQSRSPRTHERDVSLHSRSGEASASSKLRRCDRRPAL
ncbi:MAG: hypothetical protein R3B96_17165 [Pirellulaceae bacterium]